MTLSADRRAELSISIQKISQHAVVTLGGELDLATVGEVYAEFNALVQEGICHISLDLSGLEFVDSTGLSAFVTEHNRVEGMGGELIIFSPRPRVRRLFEVSGLSNLLDIRPGNSESDATSGSASLS